jgi:DNA-directed RNA polymerase subunit RPC12/RpoP
MTSPPTKIRIVCPECGKKFQGYYRPSINLSLGEKWTEEEIEKAMSVVCPHCGTRTRVGGLVVGGDGTFRLPVNPKES